MGNIQSQLKVNLMNSIAIKLHVENTSSRSVYAERRSTREHILKIFSPDLINSHIEVCLPNKSPTPNNTGRGLKVPHIQFWKDFFVQYDKKKNFSFLLAPIPIKYLHKGTNSSAN